MTGNWIELASRHLRIVEPKRSAAAAPRVGHSTRKPRGGFRCRRTRQAHSMPT